MKRERGKMILAVAAVVVVIAAVAAAWLVIPSPGEARRYRMDERRVGQLRSLSSLVQDHYQLENELPADIAPLTARQPQLDLTDPVTGEPYEYERTGADTYRLCATFAEASRRGARVSYDDWYHGAGRHCFERKAEQRH